MKVKDLRGWPEFKAGLYRCNERLAPSEYTIFPPKKNFGRTMN
jgi:hypothetical protein